MGFVKDEKMSKYYLNNGDAYRLKLWIEKKAPVESDMTANGNGDSASA